MQEKTSQSNSCEMAAVRVHCWIGQEKAYFFLLKEGKNFSNSVRSLKIPSQVEPLSLPKYALKRKENNKNRNVTRENSSQSVQSRIVNQKNWSQNQKEKALCSARVAYRPVKEHLIVSKKLKNFSKQKSGFGSKKHQVVRISTTKHLEPPHDPYLQEWERIKPERHFQIGRVIKYLVD